MKITLFARDIPGSLARYNVKLNGKSVTKIALGEEKEIQLPAGTAEIQVRQFNGKSNKLTVSNGDYIEIRLSEWNVFRVLSYLLFTYVLLFFDLINTSAYFILSAAVILVLFGYFDTFKLTKSKVSPVE